MDPAEKRWQNNSRRLTERVKAVFNSPTHFLLEAVTHRFLKTGFFIKKSNHQGVWQSSDKDFDCDSDNDVFGNDDDVFGNLIGSS